MCFNVFFPPSLLTQVALNQAYNEALNSASDVLSTTIEEQSSLMKEVCPVNLCNQINKSHNLLVAAKVKMSRKKHKIV